MLLTHQQSEHISSLAEINMLKNSSSSSSSQTLCIWPSNSANHTLGVGSFDSCSRTMRLSSSSSWSSLEELSEWGSQRRTLPSMPFTATYTASACVIVNVYWKPSHTHVCLSFCLTSHLINIMVRPGSLQKCWQTTGVGFLYTVFFVQCSSVLTTWNNRRQQDSTLSNEEKLCLQCIRCADHSEAGGWASLARHMLGPPSHLPHCSEPHCSVYHPLCERYGRAVSALLQCLSQTGVCSCKFKGQILRKIDGTRITTISLR